jgi:hypothetical protein
MSTELLMSNMNVSKPDAILRGGAWFEDFTHQAGYDGIELTPVRGRLLYEARLGRAATLTTIRSMHQSFVPDIFMLPFSAVMPQMDTSLNDLASIQSHVTDRRIPVVVYPNHQMPPRKTIGTTDFTRRTDMGEKLWQVTSEVLDAWRVPFDDTELALDSLKRHMLREGLEGCVIDTHHSYAERGGIVPDWNSWLPAMDQQGLISEVHVSPARTDMGGTSEELGTILKGGIANTRTGEVLRMTHPDRVVTEIPANEIAQLGYKDIQAVHRDITASLRDYMNG